MLPFIAIGLGIVAVGAYLLDDASSSNTRAKNEYEDTLSNAQDKVYKHYADSQRKDKLDKLFKVKKAKRKIADDFYSSWKNEQKSFRQINQEIKASKELLSNFFTQKKMTENREEKRAIQQNINLVLITRKELFHVKDTIFSNMQHLKSALDQANTETRKIQDEINYEI